MQTIKQYCEYQRFSMMRGAEQSFNPERPSIEITLDNPYQKCDNNNGCEECLLEKQTSPKKQIKPEKTHPNVTL